MVTPLISSDGYWSNSTLRLSPVETCSRPFSRVVAKSGDRPRTEMFCARPATRCAARPGRRAMDSAMEVSGSLPISSAEMASTMEVAFFLTEIASSIPRRMPDTVTVCIGASAAWPVVVVCAYAEPAKADTNTAHPAATGLSRKAVLPRLLAKIVIKVPSLI